MKLYVKLFHQIIFINFYSSSTFSKFYILHWRTNVNIPGGAMIASISGSIYAVIYFCVKHWSELYHFILELKKFVMTRPVTVRNFNCSINKFFNYIIKSKCFLILQFSCILNIARHIKSWLQLLNEIRVLKKKRKKNK